MKGELQEDAGCSANRPFPECDSLRLQEEIAEVLNSVFIFVVTLAHTAAQ